MADKTSEELVLEKLAKLDKMQEDIIANAEITTETKKAFNEFVAGLKMNKTFQGVFAKDVNADKEEDTKVMKAISQYMAVGEKHLTADDSNLLKAYGEKLLSGDNNPTIGYLLPTNVSGTIIEYVRELSPMRQQADQITISKGNSYTTFREVSDSEWESYTRAERENVFETEEGKLEKVEIYTHELTAMPVATLQMIEDAAVDLPSWIRKKVGTVFAVKEGTQFVKGTGLKEASGFLTDTSIGFVTSAVADEYGYNDLVDLQVELKTAYAANAKFYGSRKQWGYILKLKDTQDRPLINPSALKEGERGILLGDPFVEMPDMPDVQTGGTIVLAYGDMKQAYLIVDRLGITVIRDDLTTKGAVKFWFRKRLGGKTVLPEALKLLKTKA